MASFDQTVPQNAPDPLAYTRLFHPIETPQPDLSKATLIKGVTNSLEEGINAADQTMQKHAEYLGEQMGEKEQSDFLSNVQVADNLANQKDNVPSQLANGLNFLSRNKDAYDQGKLRETEYLRNLYEKAKALRQQYPTYRDYIDRGVEKATGITPNANALIKSLLQDINDKKSKADKFNDEIERTAITKAANGDPNAYLAYKNLKAGVGDHMDLLHELQKSDLHKNQAEVSRDNFTVYENGNKYQQAEATRAISQDYSAGIDQLWHNFKPSFLGNQTLEEAMADLQAGKSQFTSDQWAIAAQQWEAAVTAFDADRNRQYNQPGGKNKTSLKTMAGEQYENTIKNASTLLPGIRKALADHDTGAMQTAEMLNKAQSAEDTRTLRSDPMIGPVVGVMQGFKQAGGEQIVPMIWTNILQNNLGSDAFSKNNIMLLIAKMASGQRYSMNNAADALAGANKNQAGGGPNDVAMRTLLKDVPATLISRPDVPDQVKRNVILASFGPDNEGLLAKVPSNATINGKEVQGRQSVYEAYTSPNMVKEIKRIADDGHPRLWEYYKQWNINEFSSDLFGDDVRRLSQIEKMPNFELHFQDGAGSSPPKFLGYQKYRGSLGGTLIPVENTSKDIHDTIDNVNKAVIGLYNVYSAEGGSTADVKAHILQVLQAHGVNPNEGNSMARQVLISVGTKKPAKDESKAKQNE